MSQAAAQPTSPPPVKKADGTLSRAEEKLRAFHEEGAIEKSYDLLLLRNLWPFVKPHLRYLVMSLLALLAVAGLGLLRPIVMGAVVDHAGKRQADLLFRDGAILGGLVVVAQLVGFVQMYTMQLAGAYSMADLRVHIFRFLQKLPLRFFDKTPVGRLVTRATNDVDSVSELFSSGVLNAFGDLIALVGIIVAMLSLDYKLALIAFAALPFVGILVYFIRQGSKRAYRDIRTKTARLNAFLNEQVGGVAVVQAYAREAAMAREFDEINAAFRDANKRSIFFEALLDAAIEMISTLCIASVLLWAGAARLTDHPVSFALLVTFTQYIRQFFEPISMLTQRYTILQSALAGAERIFQLLTETDSEAGAQAATALASPERSPKATADEALAFDNVQFEYKPGVPVLRGVSLHARAGEKIALVGATGAGKSTVASLALRLYPVTGGEVRVMGRSVRDYQTAELRQQFSVVPQDVFLFPGTVLSNIAMGEEKPDEARAREALRRIGADEIFERRGGLSAKVDERGTNFSAGERQLLSFARAVYRPAPILILDEATASVDSDTESRLQRALDELLRGRTALIVAHRLSTIRAADRIVVFHKGRVVEVGSHEELLAHNGVYARLYHLQFARTEKRGPATADGAA